MKPILSLCIPTNGKVEWVTPVLESIYAAGGDEELFEVVVEDNGGDDRLKKVINEYNKAHSNIRFYKSKSEGFLCQIDSFKHATGAFIKFVNHRSMLLPGALEYLIEFARANMQHKPVVYFSNGSINASSSETFDGFVKNLSYLSSWSGGLAFWSDDIQLLAGMSDYSVLFPHICMLFARKNASRYLVDDKLMFGDIDTGHGAKGHYNLYFAFACEYPTILCNLLRKEIISIDTFLSVKNELLSCLADFYIQFIIRKQDASYSFDNYNGYMQVYYSRGQIARRIVRRGARQLIGYCVGMARAMLSCRSL